MKIHRAATPIPPFIIEQTFGEKLCEALKNDRRIKKRRYLVTRKIEYGYTVVNMNCEKRKVI